MSGDTNNNQKHSGSGDNVGRDKHVHIYGEHEVPSQLTSKLGKSTIIGRKKELQEIDQQLNSSNALLLINGIGGVGKSNIASYYLHSHKEEFAYYGFFEGLDSFIVELREPLDLKAEKPHDAFLEALSKLRKLEGNKLLVLDDVKEIEENRDRIDGILALKGSGYKILFTSRSKIKDISKYTLPILSIDDAIELFLEYYPTKDKKSVEQIVKYLDYHTLFVELLAKTVKNEGYKLDFILQKFEKGELSKIELIDKATGAESTFNNILQELFSLQNLSNEYILLLKKISLLPSIEIEFSFLKRVIKNIRRGKVKFLVRRGWLINQGDNYKLHQIIKVFIWANHQPTLEEMDKIVLFFTKLIENSDDVQLAVLLKEYLIYFEAIDDVLNRVGIFNEKITEFWENLATIYKYSELYKEAKFLVIKVIKIREKVLGEEHPDTATSYNNLALLYNKMGEYQKAEILYLKALKIYEKVLGEEHPHTATSYNNLAGLYRSMGEYQKAESLYLKALKIREKLLGEEHPDTATSYNELANLYQSMGEYQKAETLYLKALEIFKKVLGEAHPYTAKSYNSLGVFYYSQGEFGKAYPYAKKAFEVWSKVFPSNHPDLINSKKGLKLIEQKLSK